MTKPTNDSRITSATVEAAKRDADAGLDWQHPDPECKGLALRVRGRGVSWTFRGPRLAGQNRRWTLGDHRVSPKEARQRAWAVRGRLQQGLDPTSLVTALVTGVDEQQQLDLRIETQPSWEWSDAIDRFLVDIIGTTRQATRDDYRGTLKNTPELRQFKGRQVCDIVREEIAEAVEKVRKRGVKTHHKKVLITCRRFFNWLGADARRRETSVPANFLLGAKAGAAERNVPGRRVVNKGIPDARAIGRALAIARAGVLGALPSLGIQMVLGTVSRRRGVVGARRTMSPTAPPREPTSGFSRRRSARRPTRSSRRPRIRCRWSAGSPKLPTGSNVGSRATTPKVGCSPSPGRAMPARRRRIRT